MISNSLFGRADATQPGTGNTAERGERNYADSSHLTLNNCTLADNDAVSGQSGAIDIDASSSLMVKNSILWDNGGTGRQRIRQRHD